MPTPLTVVIFGASGDLAARKLIPALYNLARKGRLPAEATILGVARTPFSDDAFRDKMREAVSSHKGEWDAGVWDKFAKQLYYVPADVTGGGPDATAPLREWFSKHEGAGGGRRVYYLSVKPEL